MLKKLFMLLAVALLATQAHAVHILEVDLSVPNEVTITGTGNPSSVDASGSDTTGVYLENFYGGAGGSLGTTSTGAGDLTNTENPSDGSPALFRGGGGSDPGLNIWSFSSDATVTFTAGSSAFTGSGTWALDPPEYADMLAGMSAGNVYFPADTEDDIAAGAVNLGRYAVVVPEPASLAMISMLGLGLLGLRRR